MRLIDADKADVNDISCYYGASAYLEDVQEWLNEQPTADVEKVKHGYNKSSMNPVDEFICSECGAMFADVSLVEEDEENGDINYYEFEFKYCPNCGAKMDGGKNG